MCWQLTLSVSQILAAAINRGMESNMTPTAYRVPIGFQLVFPGLVFLLIYFVPESPRWLVRQGKEREAVRSLQAIRRGDQGYDAQADMETLRRDVRAEAELTAESSWIELVTNPVERRKLIYSAGALIAQQVSASVSVLRPATDTARSTASNGSTTSAPSSPRKSASATPS